MASLNIQKIIVPVFITAIAGYIVSRLFTKAKSAQNLNIKITGIDFPKKMVNITLINPYNGSLDLKSITGDVIFNGNAVGTLFFTTFTNIPPNKTVQINVPIRINPLDAGGVLLDLLKLKVSEWKNYFKKGTFSIKGDINMSNLLVPFEQNWKF